VDAVFRPIRGFYFLALIPTAHAVGHHLSLLRSLGRQERKSAYDNFRRAHHYDRRRRHEDFRVTFETALSMITTVFPAFGNKTAAGGEQTEGAGQ